MEEKLSRPFNYGGQAVLEGVMMRGSKAVAVAVRDPQGKIVLHSEPLNPQVYGGPVARLPFLRGLTMLWDSLVLGMRALMYSADVAASGLSASILLTLVMGGWMLSAEGASGDAGSSEPAKSGVFE